MKVLVIQSCPTFVTPWTVAHQAPLSMEFSRQQYWSGLPFPSPGDLPDLGIEPRSPTLQAVPYHLSHLKSQSLRGEPIFQKLQTASECHSVQNLILFTPLSSVPL